MGILKDIVVKAQLWCGVHNVRDRVCARVRFHNDKWTMATLEPVGERGDRICFCEDVDDDGR
jgi:hypothetical protein